MFIIYSLVDCSRILTIILSEMGIIKGTLVNKRAWCGLHGLRITWTYRLGKTLKFFSLYTEYKL